MIFYLGEEGLENSQQEPFPKITKCHKCGSQARIMFVGFEDDSLMEDYQFHICDLRGNGGEGDYWVHDAVACAVYLCTNCFEPTAILNQA